MKTSLSTILDCRKAALLSTEANLKLLFAATAIKILNDSFKTVRLSNCVFQSFLKSMCNKYSFFLLLLTIMFLFSCYYPSTSDSLLTLVFHFFKDIIIKEIINFSCLCFFDFRTSMLQYRKFHHIYCYIGKGDTIYNFLIFCSYII